MIEIKPCRDDEQLRAYIDEHWRKDHVLARDPRMFDFQYRTPWVERSRFPNGTSVVCAYKGGDLVGFLGAIVAPYPRGLGYWLALWHVLEKGVGLGGKLLAQMESAAAPNAWIGCFGAGSKTLPIYLRSGFAVRAVRRWIFDPKTDYRTNRLDALPPRKPDPEWVSYRFERHPVFSYDRTDGFLSRTEDNEWGRVTHVSWFDPAEFTAEIIFERQRSRARGNYLMDYWGFEWPGRGWRPAPKDLPSVFHPPASRGDVIYASGKPFMPDHVGKGDGDQDRPN